MPELIDMHVHIWNKPELSAYLAYEVTTVRNASGMPFHLSFAKDIESEKLPGSRLITTGSILNGQGSNTQPNHQIVNNTEEVRKALKLLVNAGLTPYEAIKTAIINPAQVLGFGNKLGQIKVGYIADLILLDENPVKNIAALDSLSGLIVKGQWYNIQKIARLKEQAADTSYIRSMIRVIKGLAAQNSLL